MKISYNWLQDYFEEKLPEPERVGSLLTMHSFEIDSISSFEGDTIYDIKVLPDRAHDCMSHYGIARELGILLPLAPKLLELELKGESDFETEKIVHVHIENTEKCRRAMKRVVRGIKVAPSPDWLVTRLASVGQRSINNIVDVANFVMLETGQPVHTFDLAKISGDPKEIYIRNAKDGETITALDGKEYTLDDSMLVIADGNGPLDIAGIKGGAASGIDKGTTDVLLSVCNFEPTNIRKTRTKLNLKTDASDRFEKGLSSKTPKLALLRLSHLVHKLAGGELSEDIIDVYPNPESMRHVTVTLRYINSVLGLSLSEEGIEGLFRKLMLGTEKIDHGVYRVAIPTNRLDISIPADIAEEIGRVYGYEKIPVALLEDTVEPATLPEWKMETAVRNHLFSQGYSEIYTYAFTKKGEVALKNPIASDKGYLRANLSDGFLEAIAFNSTILPLLNLQKFKQLKIFEIGTVFTGEGENTHVVMSEGDKIVEKSINEFCEENDISVSSESNSQLSHVKGHRFVSWSQFPFISRDIALWVPEEIKSEEVSAVIKENAGDLLVAGPTLFDTFTKEGRTSYAFRLVFQSMERTLTDTEISEIMTKITKKLESHPNWVIR